MPEFYNAQDWGAPLPDGVTPMPNVGPPCVRCGEPTHIYEADLQDLPEGIVCGACTRRQLRRQQSADGRREITKQHKWKHGHDPDDDADYEQPDTVFVNIEQVQAPAVQRPEFGGGPETPFPCETCGTRLRAVAERTVEQVLRPLGYKTPEGTTPPKDTIVALVCPNDKPDQRHKYMQIRRSLLEPAMRQMTR